MLREITYSSIRAGSYEPIKVALGGTDRHHTTMAIKMKAGAVAGMKLHNNEFPSIATAELYLCSKTKFLYVVTARKE